MEEITTEEMGVDGCYVVARIARHEYKQGWNFPTLRDGYGLCEATWEPMSAFIQPDGTISPIFRSHLVKKNESQLLTRAETLHAMCALCACCAVPGHPPKGPRYAFA